MKIALCFCGLVGGAEGNDGKGFTLDPETASYYFKKNIINLDQDVDVFVHSWSKKEENEIIKSYNPKSYTFEDQIKFYPWNLFFRQLLHPLPLLKLIISGHVNIFSWIYNLSTRAQSRWYSSKKSIELALDYQKKNNFEYDYIMVTRLDLIFFKEINFREFNKDYFYVPNRNKGPNIYSIFRWNSNNTIEDDAFGDLFFFSNPSNMKKFAKLFDLMSNYSLRPPFAAKEHISKITNKIKKVLIYGEDYYVIRMFLFGD